MVVLVCDPAVPSVPVMPAVVPSVPVLLVVMLAVVVVPVAFRVFHVFVTRRVLSLDGGATQPNRDCTESTQGGAPHVVTSFVFTEYHAHAAPHQPKIDQSSTPESRERFFCLPPVSRRLISLTNAARLPVMGLGRQPQPPDTEFTSPPGKRGWGPRAAGKPQERSSEDAAGAPAPRTQSE